ncbi:MAG: hypothetical protein ACJ77K_09235 [Bacteroidia bacterium]
MRAEMTEKLAHRGYRSGTLFVLTVVLLLRAGLLNAQIVVDEELKRLYYDRTKRITKFSEMNDFRDVFHKDKFLLGKKRILGNVSMNLGRIMIDDGKKIHPELRAALGFYMRIRFFEEFSVNATFYKDFNPRAVARWTNDFSYAIGRYNWRPRRFNFGYENYLNNKYSDDWKTFSDKFMEGYYFLSYSHLMQDKFFRKISIDNSSSFRFTYFARYSIKYEADNKELKGDLLRGKPTVGAGFRYTIGRNLYVESAVYLYENGQQAPWDPDYSYGFGYFDWRSFRLQVTYGNWAVNRFPWKKSKYPYYGFLDGNFRIAFNYIW